MTVPYHRGTCGNCGESWTLSSQDAVVIVRDKHSFVLGWNHDRVWRSLMEHRCSG